MMKVLCMCVLVSGVFGVFGEKEGSISSLTTSCSSTSSCNSETITDDAVLCHGYSSCDDSTISFSSYAYVGGMRAGSSSTLTASSDGGLAICGGRYTCEDAIVTTNDGDIQCVGSVSCIDAILTTSGGNTDCKGETSCQNSDISTNTLNCDGSESCNSANIVASDELYITGDNAGDNAFISHTPTVYASGENSLNGAIISSNGTGALKVYSYGYGSASETTVLCYSGSWCEVNCDGYLSCDNIKFYCENDVFCVRGCTSCGNCPDIDYVDSIADDVDLSSLLLKNKQDKQDAVVAPVIMENNNNARINNGINNNINSITDGTLILIKILCLAALYEIVRRFVIYSRRCFLSLTQKTHQYQKINDVSLNQI